MKTVTRKELVDYIMAQPDDRLVDMSTGFYDEDDACSCVMTHYGREHGFKFGYSNSHDGWRDETWSTPNIGIECSIFDIVSNKDVDYPITYKELRERLIPEDNELTPPSSKTPRTDAAILAGTLESVCRELELETDSNWMAQHSAQYILEDVNPEKLADVTGLPMGVITAALRNILKDRN